MVMMHNLALVKWKWMTDYKVDVLLEFSAKKLADENQGCARAI